MLSYLSIFILLALIYKKSFKILSSKLKKKKKKKKLLPL